MDCRTTSAHKFITRLGFNSNLGGLFRGLFWCVKGRVKLTPPPMLETLNLVRK